MKRIFTPLISLLFISWIAQAQPATQATNIVIEPVSATSLKINWTNGGDGDGRVVVISNSTGSYIPPNASTQAVAGTAFPTDGGGADLDAGAGEIAAVVYNNTGNTVTVTGLTANTFYTIRVYQYTGTAGTTLYNFNSASNNPRVTWYATANTTYTVPTAVSDVTVQAWGGGGAGGGVAGSGSEDRAGGGGSGGSYTQTNSVTVTPAASITVTVGTAGAGASAGNGGVGGTSTFASGTPVTAVGGAGGLLGGGPDQTGAGGATTTGTTFNGGAGAQAEPAGTTGTDATSSGGGGGGAGISGAGGAAGTSGAGITAGAAGSGGGGIGGAGRTTSGAGNAGTFPAGAGSGGLDFSNNTSRSGGAGAAGLIIVTHNVPVGPTFVSSNTSTTTQIKVKFNSAITSITQASGADFTITGAIITAAAIDGGDATFVNLTVNTIASDFSCSSCLTVAAGAVSNGAATNALISNQNVTDGVAPTAPDTPTSPIAGTTINAAEEVAGVVIRVPLGTSGAVSGDVVRILLGGIDFSPAITATLNGTDITNTYKELTIPTTKLGVDGAKSITARVEDVAANIGAVSPALGLTLDTGAPTSTATFTKTLIKNLTAQTVTITFGELVTGTPTITIDGDMSPVLVNNQAMTMGADASIWTYNAGSAWALDGEVFTVTVGTATDAAGNVVNANPATNTFTVDNSAPAAPPITAVTTNAGGTVVPGYYNISNVTNTAGITVAVTVANDATLVGGTLQLEVANQDVVVAYINLGSAANIPTANTSQNIVISHAILAANGEYGDGKILSFRAVITDAAGNSTTGATFGSTLTVDLTAPTNQNAVLTGNATASGGGTVTITAGSAADANFLAPSGTTTFTANGTTITTAAGNATSIIAPTTSGTYYLFVVDAAGNPSAASTATLAVADAPSTNSTIGFTSVTDVSMTVTLTGGNGARRLVIAKLGSAVTMDPTNFTAYTASSDWNNGAPTGTSLAAGEYMVYDGTGTSFSFTNLQAGTYHFACYDYNGTSTATGAFNLTQTTGNQATLTQATNITFGTPTTTTIPSSWTNGTGTNRILIVRTSGAVFTPVNGTTYTAATNFTSGTDLNGGVAGTVKCIFNGAGSSVTVTNLTADNVAYDFQVYEYTGSAGSEVYLTSTASGNPATRNTIESTAPTAEATVDTITNITATSLTFEVTTPGNGASRMIVISNGTNALTFNPTDGVTYTANTDYTAGSDIDSDGSIVAKVVGFGSGPITVTGLTGDQTYRFSVFEFNGTQGTGAENYYTTEYARTRNTEPTTQASALNFSSVNVSEMVLNWTIGNGDRTLVLMRQGSAVDANPTDLTAYTASANWGVKGTQVGTGNYVVYDGNGSSTGTITNLQANTTYHFAVYEYNSWYGGSVQTSTLYAAFLTPAATASQATSVDGTQPGTFTVGTVTAKGGREVAGYYNSTNGTIDVVIPLQNGDPTLDGGTIQLQFRQSLPVAGTFNNISGTLDAVGSGYSTITYAERVAGTKTISVSEDNLDNDGEWAEGATFQITAIISDYTGNTRTGTQSSTNTVIDQTLPTIPTATVTFADNGSGRETLTLTFSETLGMTNGAIPLLGTPGFTVSDADGIRNGGATAYSSSTNTIVLESPANGNWAIGITVTYTAGSPSGNIVRDLAGNELATITKSSSDATGPTLITGMIFNPNGTSAEQITFQLSEQLNLNDGDPVVGFSISEGTIATAIYSGKGTTNTITLTSGGDGTWNDEDGTPITVTYTQSGTSNVKDPSNNEMGNFSEPILLRLITISSNNANPAYAKTGDVVTVTFSTSRTLTALPTVSFDVLGSATNIAGNVTPVSGPFTGPFTATATMTSGVEDLAIDISINAVETGKSTTTVYTTNGSSVLFDKTPPTVVLTDDHPDAIVRDADAVIITATFVETNTPIVNPTISISQVSPAITNVAMNTTANPLVWTYTWDVPSGATNDGLRTVTISAKDQADNSNTAATGQTSYTIDNTAPTVTSIVVNPTIVNPYAITVNGVTPAIQGNVVSYLATFSEPVSGVAADYSDFDGGQLPNTLSDVNLDPSAYTPTPVGGSPAAVWTLTADYISGAGTFQINFDPATSYGQTGTGNISANNGINTVSDVGATTNFTGQLAVGYDIYINGDEYLGTINCCINASSFNLEYGAVVIAGGNYTGSFSYDPSPIFFPSAGGNITSNTTSNMITGSGTSFMGMVQVGDLIIRGGGGSLEYIGTVEAVLSNTSLQLTNNARLNWSGNWSLRRSSISSSTSQIVDVAGNPISTTYLAGTYGNFALAQPATGVAALSATSTGTSVTVTWTDLLDADHYLVMLKDGTGTFSTVADGTYFADDASLADGLLRQNINQGIQSATFTGLTSGTAYEAIIYAYTLDDNTIVAGNRSAIDYNTTGTRASVASDIVRAAFAYPDDIDYTLYQATDIPPGAPTTGVNGNIVLEQFTIRDGGSANNDTDNLSTNVSSITIDVTNYQNLNRLAIFDGNTEIKDLTVSSSIVSFPAPNVARITFNSFVAPLTATDDANKTFSLRASFLTTVTDNDSIAFQVFSVTASTSPAGSQFKAPSPSSVQSVLAGDNNRIEVVASKLDFTTIPLVGASASIAVPITPQVIVYALDANNNLDEDYIGAVTLVETFPANDAQFHTINNPTGPFVDGVLAYPTNFQFDVGSGIVKLEIEATAAVKPGSTAPGGAFVDQRSPDINVVSSFESELISAYSLGSTVPRSVDYIDYQSTNIDTVTNTPNAFLLDQYYLIDGDYVTASGSFTPDADGAPTILDDLTLVISNAQVIRKIAIYTQNITTGKLSEIAELDSTSISIANGIGEITFSNLNLTAQDGSNTPYPFAPIQVLATFTDFAADLTDHDSVRVAVKVATLNPGSKFAPDAAETGTIGGVATSTITLPEATITSTVGAIGYKNYIDAVATSLDFVTQPVPIAGMLQPIDATTTSQSPPYTAIVHARDENGIIDLDFTTGATVSATASPSTGSSFVNGILDLSDIQYNTFGDGTLTVEATNPATSAILNSNSLPWASSIDCDPVDVINLNAVINTTGVLSSPSLKGGNVDQPIFGFTFVPENPNGGEPQLSSFSITFKNDNLNPYYFETGTASQLVFSDFNVLESDDNPGTTAGATNVTSLGATVVKSQSAAAIAASAPAGYYDMITVTFSSPRDVITTPKTYYLLVDVAASTNISTPAITPYLESLGYGTASYNQVDVTEGSGVISPTLQGITRTFASTKPPSLVSSYPASGQLNVEPNLAAITLTFDVNVTTFDGVIELWDKETGTLYTTLTAANGVYGGTQANPSPALYVVKTIQFDMPVGVSLVPDKVYYVKIAPGAFNPNSINDPTTRAGLADDGLNLFGGITFSGTLYFKAANPNPPFLTGTKSSGYYFSPSSTTINAKFDQRGTAYFMITNNGASAPTNAQIKGTDLSYDGVGGTVFGRGTINVNNIDPDYQYGTISRGLNPNITYAVWMYAENDALPTPIPTSAPYGSNFVAGSTGPTFTITVPDYTATPRILNNPTYNVCAGEYVTLPDPIIISERTVGDFTTSGVQSIIFALPTGFQFDTESTPNIQFNGPDFSNTSWEFFNTTILKLDFSNSGATGGASGFEHIMISDMVVIAASSGLTGTKIKRIGSGAIPGIPNDTDVATLNSYTQKSIPFDNSYSDLNNFDLTPISITGTVTYIPDNYVDPTLLKEAVRLLPQPDPGDYGPTSFSGSGVTDDQLSLTAVVPNTAFNISLEHIDMNGCSSTEVNTYNVYDHRSAIPQLGTLSPVTDELQIGIVNNNFPGPATLLTNPTDVNDSVSYNGRAGFQLLELFAGIPDRLDGLQIMSGTGWESILAQVPVEKFRRKPSQGDSVASYYWNYIPVLNATPNVYDYFIETSVTPTPIKGSTVYRGGSLGVVEFTGKYQSTADYTVYVPIRQEVEVFVPPVPVVESSSTQFADQTALYCENGADISIIGYPLASAGSSTGFFTLYDSAAYADSLLTANPALPVPIASLGSPDPDFTDNDNGTASLDPSGIPNNYRTIRVEYTFQEDNSPISGTGVHFVRVTPNPVASFRAISQLAKRDLITEGRPYDTLSYCEDNWITFINTSTFTPANDPNTNQPYSARKATSWDFGNPSEVDNIVTDSTHADTVSHTYGTYGSYTVKFSANSQYNCPSQLSSDTIYVGAIPTPSFKMTGISTDTEVVTEGTSTVASNAAVSADSATLWYFGDPPIADPATMPFTTDSTYLYTMPGHYDITMLYQTKITNESLPGCEKSYQRHVIIVPGLDSVAVGAQVTDYFENVDPLVQWQTDGTYKVNKGDSTVRGSSWVRAVANKPTINTSTSNTLGYTVWVTDASAKYDSGEVSYLYSAAYDLHKLQRPMVGFSNWTYMDQSISGNDGVALDFSTDNLNVADPDKQWYRLGKQGEGKEWYNRQGLASKPGSQTELGQITSSGDYGWNRSGTGWVKSLHSLRPELPADPDELKRVIFRFALSSVGNGDEGIAIDSFRIGERTRVILVENFSNLGRSAPEEKIQSNYLQSDFNGGAEVGLDYVKLVYHVDFPQVDPFNLDNPADPSARALYYNVGSTPYARLDGIDGSVFKPLLDNNKFNLWGKAGFDDRTLELAKANLTFIEADTTIDGAYKVSVKVEATSPLPTSTILHVVLAERKVTLDGLSPAQQNMIKTGEQVQADSAGFDHSFEYVVKKMLPSASGTRFTVPLDGDPGTAVDSIFTFPLMEWTQNPDTRYANANDMVIIAFLQDEVTREVHQAIMSPALPDPALITDTEDPEYAKKISFFPNPANQEVNILLPYEVTKTTPVMMLDAYGKEVYQNYFSPGQKRKMISTTDMAAGMYIIRITTPDGGVASKKIMVVH